MFCLSKAPANLPPTDQKFCLRWPLNILINLRNIEVPLYIVKVASELAEM
jgi:hypothetical protein